MSKTVKIVISVVIGVLLIAGIGALLITFYQNTPKTHIY